MSENGQHRDTLTPEQRRAVEVLVSGGTKEAAAAVANRTRRTVDRWIADDPAFSALLRAATDQTVADAARRLTGLLDLAISAVAADLEGGELAPADNRRTLDTVAKLAIKLRELAELEDRVRALEERLEL